MGFIQEPIGFEKTILSDLQGAWEVLRETVVENAGFNEWDRMLLYIDEAMSWEIVRDLSQMNPLLVLIRNIAVRNKVSNEMLENIENITVILNEILEQHLK